MQTILRTSFALWLGLGGALVLGAEEPHAASQAKAVAPLIDSQTVGLVYVDLGRVQIEPFLKNLEVSASVSGPPHLVLNRVERLRELAKLAAVLQQAGGREIYLVVSLADIPAEPPLAAFPMTPGLQQDAVAQALQGLYAGTKPMGSLLVAAGPKGLARLEKLTPDPRPYLQGAFEAAGDAPVQLLLIPTAAQREIIRQMMPRLPRELGGGSIGQITGGLVWAAIGANPSPNGSLRLVIQSEDEKAAAGLRAALAQVVRSAATYQDVRQSMPGFEQVAETIMPQVKGNRLVTELDESQGGMSRLLTALGPLVEKVQGDNQARESLQHLKQFVLAMHSYVDRHKRFPPHASYSPDGKPLLSWRVLILPYLGQNGLYRQFHLDEPWDSEHNRKLIERMPDIYRSPNQGTHEKGRTTYVVPVGGGAIFGDKEAMRIQDIADGTCNTILVVEVPTEKAVVWTKPEDLNFDPKQPASGLDAIYPGGFPAASADGAAHFLPSEVLKKPDLLRALFTAAGGEVFDWP